MPDKNIPHKELRELIERNQRRLELRIKNIIEIEEQVGKKGESISKLGTRFKIIIIILGAIIATRVVADRLWPLKNKNEATNNEVIMEPLNSDKNQQDDKRGSRKEIEIIFTILSVGIASIGGLDGAFKPGEVATEINFMKVKCRTTILETEERWAKEVELLGVSREALENSLTLLIGIDKCLNETMIRLAQLKIHLSTKKPKRPVQRKHEQF